jgi:hypothetical protein
MGWKARRGPANFDEKEIQRVREARLAGVQVAELARLHRTSPQTISVLTRGMFPRRRGRPTNEGRVGG